MMAQKIVVGLDDSAASRAAHRWAAEYALATGMGLCAIHVLDWPIGLSATAVKSGTRFCVPQQDVAQPYWRGIHRVFDETSSPKGSVLQFAQGDVGDVLVRLSAHAGLLVVGTRESIRARPYLAGSISHYCVSHAACPVVTVPAVLAHAAPEQSGENSRHDERGLVAAN
jgi:nucleotide-binding universal stress UspA family protein